MNQVIVRETMESQMSQTYMVVHKNNTGVSLFKTRPSQGPSQTMIITTDQKQQVTIFKYVQRVMTGVDVPVNQFCGKEVSFQTFMQAYDTLQKTSKTARRIDEEDDQEGLASIAAAARAHEQTQQRTKKSSIDTSGRLIPTAVLAKQLMEDDDAFSLKPLSQALPPQIVKPKVLPQLSQPVSKASPTTLVFKLMGDNYTMTSTSDGVISRMIATQDTMTDNLKRLMSDYHFEIDKNTLFSYFACWCAKFRAGFVKIVDNKGHDVTSEFADKAPQTFFVPNPKNELPLPNSVLNEAGPISYLNQWSQKTGIAVITEINAVAEQKFESNVYILDVAMGSAIAGNKSAAKENASAHLLWMLFTLSIHNITPYD